MSGICRSVCYTATTFPSMCQWHLHVPLDVTLNITFMELKIFSDKKCLPDELRLKGIAKTTRHTTNTRQTLILVCGYQRYKSILLLNKVQIQMSISTHIPHIVHMHLIYEIDSRTSYQIVQDRHRPNILLQSFRLDYNGYTNILKNNWLIAVNYNLVSSIRFYIYKNKCKESMLLRMFDGPTPRDKLIWESSNPPDVVHVTGTGRHMSVELLDSCAIQKRINIVATRLCDVKQCISHKITDK